MERFLRTLPPEIRSAVAMQGSRNPEAMVEAMEAAERMLGLMQGDQPDPAPPVPRDRFPPRQAPVKEGRSPRAPRASRSPVPPGPREESMPTEPDPGPSTRPAKAWLAGCGVHGGAQPEAASQRWLRLDGRSVRAFMDSGSTITLLRPAEFPWLKPSGETLPVSCVHGEVRRFPTALIRLEKGGRQWPLTVGLVPDLPVPLLVGRDFPGFSLGHHPDRMKQRRRGERPRTASALLAHPKADGGEASAEVPQASTGFSPFELLYSRRPRGLLDVVREAWEQQPSPYRSVIEYVQEMQQRIDAVAPIVREHMEEAQRGQQRAYNRPAQPREFQPGDRVLVLVPTTTCKFLATWQGPYTVREKVGPVNYRLDQPGRRKSQQVYHINLLKRWVEPVPRLSGFAAAETPARAEIQWGEELSPAQRQELAELVEQFRDVFSATPGRTQVVQHDIRTPVGVTVRQRPYRVPEARRTVIEEEDFSFQVQHRPGVLHGNADALSRLPAYWASEGPLPGVSLRGGGCDRRPSHQSNVPEPRQPRAPPRAAGTAPPPSSLCCGQRRTAWPRRRGQRPPAPGGA
ncbi:hypothetical protein MHYP_G00293020 [Metynnis hypsauchen]